MSVPPPEQRPWGPEVPEGIGPGWTPASEWAPVQPEAPADPFARVPWWAPVVAMIGAFAAATIAFVAIYAIVEAAGESVDPDDPQAYVIIPATFLQDLALVVLAWVMARAWVSDLRPAAFGLARTRLWPAVGWTTLLYASFWLLAAILLLIVGQPEDQELVTDLKEEDSIVVLVSFAILVTVAAPLVEEFFFRGFLFGVLRARMNVGLAAVIGGVVFGFIHLPGSPIEGVLILCVLGIGLCLLYWRTASLLPCFALHAIHNSISFGATKSLPWWAFLAVIVGSVAVVLAIGLALSERRGGLVGKPAQG